MSQQRLPPGRLNHPSNYGLGPVLTTPAAASTHSPFSAGQSGWLRWVLLAVGVLVLIGIGVAIGASSRNATG